MTIIVTGGAGFIGSNFILNRLRTNKETIINLDKLTYAANTDRLSSLEGSPSYCFYRGNICDAALISSLLLTHKPRAIIHFAAESHVDNSIKNPGQFIETNIQGTYTLLEAARTYWDALPEHEAAQFRFLHVSTDEVYGSLTLDEAPFTETSAYAPNSPYSASKAASDHLVRAYFHTYGLPTLTTNCSNNYGPHQHSEKLIPLMIQHALSGLNLPVYGDGLQIRDWLYVGDHCLALEKVLEMGVPGEVYNIGGCCEKTNIEVVRHICRLLDEKHPRADGASYQQQISFIQDRAGHDRRYAISIDKIHRTLGWQPAQSFETGLESTLNWYLDQSRSTLTKCDVRFNLL